MRKEHMILTLLLLAEAARTVATPFGPVEIMTPRAAAERVAKCGAGTVAIRHNEELQSDVLVITSTEPITETKLVCVDQAASYFDVVLPSASRASFKKIRNERLSAAAKVETRKWLDEHKLLGRLPLYEAGRTDDAAFAKEMESLCGPEAKGAFQSPHGPHAISPDWAERMFAKGDEASLTCLLKVASATGFPLGFIGNERSAE
jgi:hypothetical protein